MPTYDQLLAASVHRERTASRRLALRTGLSTEQALSQVMQVSAGAASLADLIELRQRTATASAAKLAQRRAAKSAERAAKAAAHQPPADAWLAWFDGSSQPNPGKLGIGAILRSPDGAVIQISKMAGHGDSNEAEYLALIALLEAAVAAGVQKLVVYGDSQIVIKGVAEPHPARHLQAHGARATALAAHIVDLTLTWIPRHKNGAADGLSQRAAGRYAEVAAGMGAR